MKLSKLGHHLAAVLISEATGPETSKQTNKQASKQTNKQTKTNFLLAAN